MTNAVPAAQPRSERRVLSVLVDNVPGVLLRIVALFRRRGINIHSLAVSVTEDPAVSRITMTVECPAALAESVVKQVRRVVEVRRVRDVTDSARTERELALVKVNAPAGVRSEILEAAQVFRARPIDLTEKTVTLEVTGSPEKIDAFLNLVARHGVREVARTGSVVLLRGSAST